MFGRNKLINSKNNTGININGDSNNVTVSYGVIENPTPLQIPFKTESI